MLMLVQGSTEKKMARARLVRDLKSTLTCQGTRNVGFPGGNVNHTLYSNGENRLWCAFGETIHDTAVPRYWNAFGIYKPDQSAQMMSVEINIAMNSNTARVAGFFARDGETGDIFLMHSGKVGGGRPGIGKTAFMVWSKAKPVDVADGEGGSRSGLVIGRLGAPDFADHIWKFVRTVQNFKDQATDGSLDDPEFREKVEAFEKYSREFSGTKKGMRDSAFEYVTYHGDIVQALYNDRARRLVCGESILSSTLIDLFVKKDGALTEVYEVKTGVGRQMLYTAIGQLVTHATLGGEDVARILVIPADDDIPEDLGRAIAALGIRVRRFRLDRSVPGTGIALD
ncbi:hypothetical protein [Komagataeibacter rhaeticus]|uniref:hypothetical protein n=1 Tax=Komagataeibacter rhaeticus TaxID=215221 RepID=UPI001A426BC1|nr:hypothetical protein [Komagataeibacter rhaeticus]MBL7238876.1 hypothetical protein [Komagataeibacter rhaeticus]